MYVHLGLSRCFCSPHANMTLPCHPVLCAFPSRDLSTVNSSTLSLHDALPICWQHSSRRTTCPILSVRSARSDRQNRARSEEHTSELQSHSDVVCRLLLEKKKASPCLASTAANSPAAVQTCIPTPGRPPCRATP